jgi:ABC-type branched-subunit amino acid transport system ATPase component
MTAALEARGLRKAFGALTVTDRVSLQLAAGARHALIGPNGAGKTTLVGLLSGTLRPDAGSIHIFGEEVTRFKPAQRARRGLIRTFQVSSLFPQLTTLENVYLAVTQKKAAGFDVWGAAGKRRDLLDASEQLLAQFRLLDHAGRKVGELAYGHQRLVEMALALALEPRVLLLDEPAAGIPSGELSLLIDAIERLPREIALLIIEHDMAFVRRFAEDVTVLVHGRVFLSGSLHEIMGSQALRDVYLGKGDPETAMLEATHA